MRWLLLLTLLALTADADDRAGRFDRFCRQRSDRGLPCDGYAFFEAFPASGVDCDGSSGGLNYVRAGTYSCGQSSGFLVTVSANQPPSTMAGTDFNASGTDATVSYAFSAADTKVIEVVVVPARPWKAMTAFVPLQWGTFSAANSATLMIQFGVITYREWDGAAASSQLAASGILGEGPRRIRIVMPPTGSGSIYVDGTLVASTQTGSNRMATPPSTIRVGGLAVGSFVVNGRLRNLCLSKNSGSCFNVAPGEQGGRRIVALGDSTTGSTINVNWPTRLQWSYGMLSNLVQNAGNGGLTAAQILTQWTDNVRSRGYTTVLVLGGVNDINRDSQTAASTWPSLKSIVDQAKADGLTVGISTVLPFSASGGKATELATLNSTITTYAGANGMILLDGYTLMGDGAGNLAAAYNAGDNLHLSEAGIRAFADGWFSVLP